MSNKRMWFVSFNGQPNRTASSYILIFWLLLFSLLGHTLLGCRRTAPIHVWLPSQAPVPVAGRVAIGPIAGDAELAAALQRALLTQRPPIRSDLALLTPEQLLESSAVRLASTAALSNDVMSVAAARQAGADILLQGVILGADIDLQSELNPDAQKSSGQVDWNQAYFRKKGDTETKHETIALSWRVIDVPTGKTIGTSLFNLATKKAIEQYPDLELVEHDQTQLLIAASARESWKTVAPYVAKDRVRLASPWLQPGSFTVRRGVAAARKGNWDLAQQRWQRAADFWWYCPSAHHNLALANAAREDFPAAKAELQKATGPFSIRLPPETLVWLDQQHRQHNAALGLGTPAEGWAFPDPQPALEAEAAMRPIEVADVATLPWWTALPLAKPPGWTWQGWLTQPWAL
ncbi:MAG: hypothetical protein IT422_00090 [Pirellulaceae bacterium]|nr:hypothetical protein [Pirellulaceae bacterium]